MMKIPSFLRPIMGTSNNETVRASTPENQKGRLPYDPRIGMRNTFIDPKLVTILELSFFALAVAALTAGATLGITPLIAVGALAFVLPFVLSPFLTPSYN